MTAAMKASLEAERRQIVYFYEFTFSAGTIRLCSAAHDLTVTMQDGSGGTWTAIGGTFSFESVTESPDLNAAQIKLNMSGVDQTVIALILNNFYLGRSCKIWVGHRDPDTLSMISSPILLFKGYQNGGWAIEEVRSDEGEGHTVNLSVRAIDRLSDLEQRRGIQTNLTSHQRWYPDDKFFEFVPMLVGKAIRWGTQGG